MKTLSQSPNSSKKPKTGSSQSVDSSNALIDIAQHDVDGVLHLFDTSLEGLTETEAKQRLGKSGLNEIAREKAIARISFSFENINVWNFCISLAPVL